MSLEFLEVLEARVREAAERLEELAAENSELRTKVEKLEQNSAAAAKGDRSGGKTDKSEKAWIKERDEIRERLEALIARLETLL
ncbi:MAG: cell division protein ZapB [Thermoanaerobaculia bacterium]